VTDDRPGAVTDRFATWSGGRVVTVVAGGAIGLVAVVQLIVGRYLFFGHDQYFDDEGYMVTLYREWVAGGALYDEVYSQYGPFHTVVLGVPLRLFDVTLTLTAGRWITLVLLVTSMVLLAVTTWRLTRSVLAALLTQLLGFWMMSRVVEAPLHPVPLLMLLLAAALANVVVLRPRAPRASDVLTGALLAASLLTKANVGLFFGLAVFYVVAIQWPSGRVQRWLLLLSEAALVLVGPALLLVQRRSIGDLPAGDSWTDADALSYWALAYVASAVSVVVFARFGRRRQSDGDRVPVSLGGLALGGGITSVVVVGLVLGTGTSLGALVQGVLVRPLGQSDALTVLPRMTAETLLLLVATPLFILVGWLLQRSVPSPATRVGSAVLRVAGALGLLLAAVQELPMELGIVIPAGSFAYVPLVALVVLPRVDMAETGTVDLGSRCFLAALTVAHSLHAAPVAGLQMVVSLLLPLVCAVVVLDDGVRELRPMLATRGRSWQLLPSMVTVAVIVTAVWLYQDDTRRWVDTYRFGQPLELANAEQVRVQPNRRAQLHKWVSDVEDCDQLVTLPGFSSLNLWADIPPPTGFNTTLWPSLLDDDEQQAVVDVLRSAPGPVCLFTLRPLFESQFRPELSPDGGPLERYLLTFTERSSQPLYTVSERPAEN
jgi:hypothetical protein